MFVENYHFLDDLNQISYSISAAINARKYFLNFCYSLKSKLEFLKHNKYFGSRRLRPGRLDSNNFCLKKLSKYGQIGAGVVASLQTVHNPRVYLESCLLLIDWCDQSRITLEAMWMCCYGLWAQIEKLRHVRRI